MTPREKVMLDHDIEREDVQEDEDIPQFCMALHGNHDEHQCHKKPGHMEIMGELQHECYCGVWW